MAWKSELYKQRKKDHLCTQCGSKLSKTRVQNRNARCSKCIKNLRIYVEKRNKKLLERGICVSCGELPVDKLTNKRLCSICFKSKKEWLYKRIESVMLARAKKRAKDKNLEFSIDISDIIIPDLCPLLGVKLKRGNRENFNNSPSLDRIDSSKGYIKGNVWVISFRANKIKGDATLDEIELIAENLRKFLMVH